MVQGPAVSPAGDRPSPSAARRDAPVTPDVRADRTIEKKVGAEQHRADEENLLNPQTAREF